MLIIGNSMGNRTLTNMVIPSLNQHDYNAIVQWYKDKAVEYPHLVTFVPSIGTTGEGRDMPAIHVTASTKGKATKKVYLQSLIHARKQKRDCVCVCA